MTCPNAEFSIGIARESAYSGSPPKEYENPSTLRAFQLVGPDQIPNKLVGVYEWEIPTYIHLQSVSVENILANHAAIGGTRIYREAKERASQSGDLHYVD